MEQSTERSLMKTCSRALNMNTATAKTTQKWLRDMSLNVLEWHSQSPDLHLIEHLWGYLKIVVQQHSPSNLTALERICREEWEKIPKYRCTKLVASYPKRLNNISCFNKVLSRMFEYLCKCNISEFLKTCFCFVIMRYCV